jgi:hypothetical protein
MEAARLIAAGVTLTPTPPDALREAAQAVVDALVAQVAQDPLSSTLGDRLYDAIYALEVTLAQPKEADRD